MDEDDIVMGQFAHGTQEVVSPISSQCTDCESKDCEEHGFCNCDCSYPSTNKDTEFVKASEVHAGDELTGGRGTVTNRLNDSGLLTFETTTTTFMKDMHAPLERFVRDPNGKYGYEYLGEK